LARCGEEKEQEGEEGEGEVVWVSRL